MRKVPLVLSHFFILPKASPILTYIENIMINNLTLHTQKPLIDFFYKKTSDKIYFRRKNVGNSFAFQYL